MAHPYHHSLSSVKKWGGSVADYQSIHDWFDASKAIIADFRHRALRHHAEGIFMAETIFGHDDYAVHGPRHPDTLGRRAARARRLGLHPFFRRLGESHPPRAVDGPRAKARRRCAPDVNHHRWRRACRDHLTRHLQTTRVCLKFLAQPRRVTSWPFRSGLRRGGFQERWSLPTTPISLISSRKRL